MRLRASFLVFVVFMSSCNGIKTAWRNAKIERTKDRIIKLAEKYPKELIAGSDSVVVHVRGRTRPATLEVKWRLPETDSVFEISGSDSANKHLTAFVDKTGDQLSLVVIDKGQGFNKDTTISKGPYVTIDYQNSPKSLRKVWPWLLFWLGLLYLISVIVKNFKGG